MLRLFSKAFANITVIKDGHLRDNMNKLTTKKTIIALGLAGVTFTSPMEASAAQSLSTTSATVKIAAPDAPIATSNKAQSKVKIEEQVAKESTIDDKGDNKRNNAEQNSGVDKELPHLEKESTSKEKSVTICIISCKEDERPETDEEAEADDDEKTFRFENRRDGFQFDVSAISSVGDDYSLHGDESSDSEFDVAISYRVQLLGLFIESPGISTRRIQGMYSMPAWGLNFYNTKDWTFDLFYQYSTRGIEGLEGIQTRNKDERAGLRMTGYFDNSQFQAIYSPVSRNDDGSDGIEASLSYSHNWQFRNWNYYANLGLQYRSKEVTPYELQTFIDDDLSFKDGINYSAEVGFEYPLTTDWVFGGFVGYNALSERSIAIRQDSVEDGYRGGVLLTYLF